MSLEELTGAGKPSIFPGHTLTPPALADVGELEAFAADDFIARVHRATSPYGTGEVEAYRQRAVELLRRFPFRFGTDDFGQWALSLAALPYMAWLVFRQTEPKMTLSEAAGLIMGASPAQRSAVYALWGFVTQKKRDASQSAATHPTGTPISPTSPPRPPADAATPTERPAS